MANVIAVSALNKYVKAVLEEDIYLSDIVIQGEISNFNRHYKTGHCYFTIKDEKASVKAVMFRTDAMQLAFSPENGMHVLARCRVSLYERDGAFQIYVNALFPDGVGAAQMAFEQLKKRLAGEGLFLDERKKALPLYPQCVGLVTSKTGASLQDILKVAARRYPCVQFLLAPVSVQGEKAAKEIVSAIQKLDKSGRVDVIIVARGGGSSEDLWVFNDEDIARAAFACQTPLVSAIGHEIDFTILDFVADTRAPTPSAAAEMVLPEIAQLQNEIVILYNTITNNMQNRLESWYNRLISYREDAVLQNIADKPSLLAHRLASNANMAKEWQQRILRQSENRLKSAADLAFGLNPFAVLARGYSVLYDTSGAIRSASQLTKGQKLNARLRDGGAALTVDNIYDEENTHGQK